MKAGVTKVQLYDVTISDGHGGTITQTITITLTGADDSGWWWRRPHKKSEGQRSGVKQHSGRRIVP